MGKRGERRGKVVIKRAGRGQRERKEQRKEDSFRGHGAATYLFLCFAEDVQRRVVELGLHSLLNLVVYVDAAG